MGAVARYAYLNARVSVMAARLLPEAQIEALIEQPLREGAGVLAESGVGLGLDESEIEPTVLEQAWLLSLLEDLKVLGRCLSGNARDLLIYWIRRFELGNLKAIIRGKMAGSPAAAIREELLDLGSFTTLRLDPLLASEDVAELLRLLEETPYGDIARQARAVFEERHDSFMLDAALDRRYYAGLAKRVKAFRGEDRQHLDRLLGAVIDHVNLVWLLRYRLAYGLPPAETYYLLVQGGYRISSSDWQELARMGSLLEVLGALPPGLRELLDGADTVSEVQLRLEQESRRIAESILTRTAFNLARALAYLVLREKEMHQVLAVLKGRRLGLSPSLIRFAAGFAALGAV